MSWWKWSGIPARIFLKLDDAVDNGDFLFGSDADSRFPTGVYQLGVGDNDVTLDIPHRWQTQWHDMDLPWALKRFSMVTLDFDDYDGGARVEWSADDGAREGQAEVTPATSMPWGNTTDRIAKLWNTSTGTTVNGLFWTKRKVRSVNFRLPQCAWGTRIQLTFTWTSAGNKPAKLLGYSIEFDVRRQPYPVKAGS